MASDCTKVTARIRVPRWSIGVVAVAVLAGSATAASAVTVSAVEVTLTKGAGNTGGNSMVEAGDTLSASITSDGGALNNAFSRWFGCRPPALASPIQPGVSDGSTDVCPAAPYQSSNITPALSNGNTTSTTTLVVPAGTGASGPAGTVLAYQTTLQATADKLWTGQIPVASSVTAQPTISTNPQSQAVGDGSTATLSVTATGNDAVANLQTVPVNHVLTYEWEKSTDSGQSWTPIAGAQSASYTTPSLALSDSGTQYRVVVTDNPTISGQKIGVSTNPVWQTQDYLAWTAPASRTSSAAVITVVAAPAVPSFTRVTPGNGTVSFEVAAGSGGPTATSFYVEAVGDATKNCTAQAAGTCSISGLTNGTSYTFVAKAIAAGNISSAFSSASVAVTPDLPPPTPGKPTVVVGDGQATVTVTPGSGGGTPTAYRAFIVPQTNPPKSCNVVGSSGSCTITGLSNGTSYTVSTLAFAAGAFSSQSVPSDPFTPVASAPQPAPDPGSGGSETSTGGSSSGGSSTAGASTAGTSPMSAAARKGMRVRARVKGQLRATPAGIVRVPLACPRAVTDGCDADGILTITLPRQVRAEGGFLANPFATRAGRQREIGRFTDIEIASGATKVVTVRITPATFAALRRARVTRVPVTLLTNNALAGAPPVRSVQRVWLAIPSAGRSIAVTG